MGPAGLRSMSMITAWPPTAAIPFRPSEHDRSRKGMAADGSHTLPTSVMFGWSVSNSVMPTSGLTAAAGTSQSISGMSGHNLWYQWISAPAAAGAYYFWAIAKNSGGAAVATYVSPSTFAIT